MSGRWPWSRLGVALTADAGQIRAAYAERLKAIDIDADPAHYQALRDARDAALDRVRGLADDDDFGVPQIDDGIAPEPAADHPEVDRDPEMDRFADHHNRLLALLFDEDSRERFLDREEEDEAVAEAEAILHHPMLDSVDNVATGSDWFADVLADASPRSDFLVPRVAAFFDWESVDEIQRSPTLDLVLGRLAAIRLADQLDDPSHRLHRAWRELTTPAQEKSRRGWVRQSKIDELLTLVRTRAPLLEGTMDSWRVSLWQNRVSRASTARLWVFGVIIIFQFARFCSADTPSKTPSRPAQEPAFEAPLANPIDDLAAPLRQVTRGELGPARLVSGNPRLYAMLEANWREARSSNTPREDFEVDMRSLLEQRITTSLRHAPPALLADMLRWRLERAEAQRIPRGCEAYFRSGRDDAPMGEFALDRQAKLRARLLLADNPTLPLAEGSEDRRMKIDNGVAARIAKATDTPIDRIVAGMSMTGDPARWCAGRKAFFSGVLDLPAAQRDPILRLIAT